MNMPFKNMLLIVIVLVLISAFSAYQYYSYVTQETLRSERISLLMGLNLTDRDTAILFDNKYNYMADDGSYNQTVLEFFSYWCVNQSLAEECLSTLKSIEKANYYLSEYYARSKRVLFLIEHAGATESQAMSFDMEYSYLAAGEEYNQSVLEFFNYWRLNSSLASNCLKILKNVDETNNYLSRIKNSAVRLFSEENLTLILSACTDKEEYTIGKDWKVNFTITVLSNKNLGEVNVDIFGFASPYKGYVVRNKWIDPSGVLKILVREGLNSKVFLIDIPCSPCYGLQSGYNSLTCVIKYAGLSLNVTKIFRLSK